jgi:uncharacterized protein DUF3592
MGDAAETESTRATGRKSYRKVWWLRFLLPVIALGAWWYFAGTAVTAYRLAQDGVVVRGESVRTEQIRHRSSTLTVKFTTADGRQIQTNTVPRSCAVKPPGETVEIRYLPSDPYTVQDTCDPPRHRASTAAALGGLALTALSVQAWRLWLRHRKTGELPPEYRI